MPRPPVTNATASSAGRTNDARTTADPTSTPRALCRPPYIARNSVVPVAVCPTTPAASASDAGAKKQ